MVDAPGEGAIGQLEVTQYRIPVEGLAASLSLSLSSPTPRPGRAVGQHCCGINIHPLLVCIEGLYGAKSPKLEGYKRGFNLAATLRTVLGLQTITRGLVTACPSYASQSRRPAPRQKRHRSCGVSCGAFACQLTIVSSCSRHWPLLASTSADPETPRLLLPPSLVAHRCCCEKLPTRHTLIASSTTTAHITMSFDKKAVHFGGGNIGRGFVAEFLHKSGYEVVFVDVMDSIIESLQKTPSYTVTEISDNGEKTFTIDHYRAINSKYEMDKVVHEIATADVVTCAVGPNILKFVAEPVAKAIEARTAEAPLAVIACENAINATTTWKGFIEAKLSEATLKDISKKARYANSAIDRIVPVQPEGSGLNVLIEEFFEWCVEQKPFENGGTKPEIAGIHYVDDLEPYIERKLFTVNTSHATAAYYGYQKKIPYIHDVLANKELNPIVRAAVKETAHLIVNKHGISTEEQDRYVESILKRISNPTLKDNVERVGRAPLRKLSRKERFIGPAAQLAERGEKVDALLGAVEQALRFQDVPGDDESVELAKILKENSAEEATTKITGLEKDHPLYAQIVPIVQKVKGS